MKKKKEKMQTKKNKRKTRRLIIVTLLFIETKGKKDKTKTKQKKQSEKQPKKHLYFWRKKNLFVCQEENSARLLVMSTLIKKRKLKLNIYDIYVLSKQPGC